MKIKFFQILFCFFSFPTFVFCATLRWNPPIDVENVTGYKIYYGTEIDNYPLNVDTHSTDIEYSLSNLPLVDGKTYYFVVTAYNSYGESENSEYVSYKNPITDATPPLPPYNLIGQVQNKNVDLKWNSEMESDISKYFIYLGTSSRNYNLPIQVNKRNSYTIKELSPGKTYFLAVTAVDISGNESGYSSEISIELPNETLVSAEYASSDSKQEINFQNMQSIFYLLLD